MLRRNKNMGEVIEDFRTGRRVLALDDKQLEVRTEELIRQVSKSLRKAPRRKAVPRWSVPSEIWLMMVCPNYQVKKPNVIGLSSGEVTLHTPVFVRQIQADHESNCANSNSTIVMAHVRRVFNR